MRLASSSSRATIRRCSKRPAVTQDSGGGVLVPPATQEPEGPGVVLLPPTTVERDDPAGS